MAKPSNDAARKSDLLGALREMLLIRRFEEKAGQLYGMGLIGGFCHLYIGQEAIVVGMKRAGQQGDQTTTSYRDHGHMLACGMDPGRIMAELTGRAGGYSRGKGGSMHMFSTEHGFFGGHGIVGAQAPIGAGLGFANRYLENGKVSVVYFGDGAADQGQVYESFGLAARWALPVVFVVENNQQGASTTPSPSPPLPAIHTRGAAFDIPGEAVDGMDYEAVKAAGARALARARTGDGPYILEMNTYRYRGHSVANPARYGAHAESNRMRDERDPIDRVRQLLLGLDVAEEALKELDRDVKAQVNAAAEVAQAAPEPDDAELQTDVYASA